MLVSVISLVASILTIFSFIYMFFYENKNIIKIIFIVCFVISVSMGTVISYQNTKLNSIYNITKSASALVSQKQDFSTKGFVYAGLSFLETVKDVYPDTYKRALNLVDKTEADEYGFDSFEISSTMRDILRGIAVLNDEE